jgi:hypothetical protein
MMGILLLKLFLVPTLVYAVTMAGRRWGPWVAGWFSAFPIVSGPILLAITLEQGAHFGAILVLLVTFAAARLGPRLSGFLAMFPVISTVLVGFSHHFSGRAFAVALLRGMVFGYYAFATFCVTVSVLLGEQSTLTSFSCAFLGALIVQLAVGGLLASARRGQPGK